MTSCERPEFVAACVAALAAQSRPPDQVLVADDGSSPACLARLRELLRASPLAPELVTQADRGFRVAAARNAAARQATGDLLLFLDGDVVLFPDALALHLALGRGEAWTTGDVVDLDPQESARLDPTQLEALWPGPQDPRRERLAQGQRSFTRKAWLARWLPCERHLRRPPLRGGHATVPRAAFEAVNGFDERYEGWGLEDDDLALRLLLFGVPGRALIEGARAFHQWHPREPVPEQGGRPLSQNYAYHKRRRRGQFRCEAGLQRP